ncbi:PP-loop superfamily ATP-utilizing enzyme [Thermanaerovibrio velox DSM 12556]|uniref:PP-loop superfamily ATP-utilizing enzyme n=1 Tax=Thermanaerovibrio velox DSM 12556 TaxID=926567 RepID=H0UR53_9BACT|nr:hypothetical protein [Thermanaerovibrio velox]EHM10890.1 PP-loop superfamily ATP-utilizing enzyme [Thermanaerovibrio velox DSM 12556]
METRLAKGIEGIRMELGSARFRGIGIIFSGSPGSVLLARIAGEVMGRDRVKLILVRSPLWHREALDFAARWAEEFNFQVLTVEIEEEGLQEVLENRPDRCYLCRKLMHRIIAGALPDRWGICDPLTVETLITQKYGTRACSEDRIMLPLGDHGMGKFEVVRALSAMGLHWRGYRGVKCLAQMAYPGLSLKDRGMERLKVLGEVQHWVLGRYELKLLDHDTAVLKPLSDKPWGWEAVRDRLLAEGFKRVLMDVTHPAQPQMGTPMPEPPVPIRLLHQSPFE